ncbi:MAG: YihY/virulence factor BrkB family protein [Vulcanimicrobiaceae bacterium]
MRRLIAVLRAAGARFSEDGCGFLAQAIAFSALFAIFPLLLLGIATLAFIYGSDEGRARALALIATLAPGIRDVFARNLDIIIHSRSISGALGLLTLAWSGKNLFLALAYALDRALDVHEGRPLLSSIAMSLIILPILGTILIAATAVPLAVTIIVRFGGLADSVVSSQLLSYGTSAIAIFGLSLLLYTYLPNQRLSLRFGIPGAIVTTLGWELAQIAFGFYTTHIAFGPIYGAVSTIAILMLWLYYMGSIFLFGAQVSAQWRRFGDLQETEIVSANRPA